MGCVTSKKDINDMHPNIFQVMNVDELGNRLQGGQLEVSEMDLVLYQRGKAPVKWPLRSLRRYGFDAELFSFESGRRCPTGPGIYAFRCRRAERLFNLLQTHIQMRNNLCSEDSVSVSGGGSRGGGDSNYLEPAPFRQAGTRHSGSATQRLGSVGSSSNGPLSPSNASPSPPNNNNNEEHSYPTAPASAVPSEVPPPITCTNVDKSPVSPTASEGSNYTQLEDTENLTPVYMNIVPGSENIEGSSTIPRRHLSKAEWEEEVRHCYANLEPGEIEGPCRPKSLVPLTLSLHSSLLMTCAPIRQVNYIVLDLDQADKPASPITAAPPPPPDSPNRPAEGYATIDFNRTVALSHTVYNVCNDNEGSRRTRHNSTIIPTTSRLSMSLSE